jgi:hypothetical protein
MNDKNQEQQHKELLGAIEKVQAPLEALALLRMADEFYPKEKRLEFYARYEELREADDAAFKRLKASTLPGDMSWEERVEKLGKEVAEEQLAPHNVALEARRETMRRVSEFEREHRLLMCILDSKVTLGKRRFES